MGSADQDNKISAQIEKRSGNSHQASDDNRMYRILADAAF